MSTTVPPSAPDPSLQFDEAEFEAGEASGLSCSECKGPIPDHYYETDGKVVCEACRTRLETAYSGRNRFRRVLKAGAFGSVAAVLGALLYYAITKATDYNIGLVSVLVGLMVGTAVKAGSGGRGGRFYQFLALFLTYSAIAGMLLPMVIEGAQEHEEQQKQQFIEEVQARLKAMEKEEEAKRAAPEAQVAAAEENAASDAAANPPAIAENAAAPATPEVAEGPRPEPDKIAEVRPEAPTPDAELEEDIDLGMEDPELKEAPTPTLAELLLALGVVAGFGYSVPVLVAAGSPMSGLIFGFALWEAWKINRKTELAFQGPFQVATPQLADEAPQGDEQHHA